MKRRKRGTGIRKESKEGERRKRVTKRHSKWTSNKESEETIY